MEQHRVQAHLINLGVRIIAHRLPTRISSGSMELACIYTGCTEEIACATAVMVTARLPDKTLSVPAVTQFNAGAMPQVESLTLIGDALAPGTIAASVWAGRRYAEEFDLPPRDPDDLPFRREVTGLVDGPLPWHER